MSARTLTALIAALACAALPATASATTERATLRASFSPDRLGSSTTIAFGFHVSTTEGTAPPPLTHVDLHMPAGMNYTRTQLGLSICQPEPLLASGLAGCSPNSRLGFGKAFVEVPFGTGAGHEIPELQAMMGPSPFGAVVIIGSRAPALSFIG